MKSRAAGKVAVIGTTVAKQLFGSDDPIGQQIRISRVPFDSYRDTGGEGFVRDRPRPRRHRLRAHRRLRKSDLWAAQTKSIRESVAYILVKVVADQSMDGAMRAIEALLKQRHRLEVDRRERF